MIWGVVWGGVGVGGLAKWGWRWGWREVGEVLVLGGGYWRRWRGWEMLIEVDGEVEREGGGVEKGRSRRRGRIRLLRARRPGYVLLIGRGRVVGE